VVLVHGFASSARNNWLEPGWLSLLSPRYRVVALDQRGHGSSGSRHDCEPYDTKNFAADVIGLMDHLAIEKAFVMDYSMGATVWLVLATTHPARFRAVVLGGIGGDSVSGTVKDRKAIIKAVLSAGPGSIGEPVAKTFPLPNSSTMTSRRSPLAGAVSARGLRGEVLARMVGTGECRWGGTLRCVGRKRGQACGVNSGNGIGIARGTAIISTR